MQLWADDGSPAAEQRGLLASGCDAGGQSWARSSRGCWPPDADFGVGERCATGVVQQGPGCSGTSRTDGIPRPSGAPRVHWDALDDLERDHFRNRLRRWIAMALQDMGAEDLRLAGRPGPEVRDFRSGGGWVRCIKLSDLDEWFFDTKGHALRTVVEALGPDDEPCFALAGALLGRHYHVVVFHLEQAYGRRLQRELQGSQAKGQDDDLCWEPQNRLHRGHGQSKAAKRAARRHGKLKKSEDRSASGQASETEARRRPRLRVVPTAPGEQRPA